MVSRLVNEDSLPISVACLVATSTEKLPRGIAEHFPSTSLLVLVGGNKQLKLVGKAGNSVCVVDVVRFDFLNSRKYIVD